MRARALRLVEHRFDVRTWPAAAFRSPRDEYPAHTGQRGRTVSPDSRKATTSPVRESHRAFCFPAAPLGVAGHRKVLLFNNSDAEDRAAVKEWREEGCRLPVALRRRPGMNRSERDNGCICAVTRSAIATRSCGLGRAARHLASTQARRIRLPQPAPDSLRTSGGVVEPAWP